jgi:hypothetical protein
VTAWNNARNDQSLTYRRYTKSLSTYLGVAEYKMTSDNECKSHPLHEQKCRSWIMFEYIERSPLGGEWSTWTEIIETISIKSWNYEQPVIRSVAESALRVSFGVRNLYLTSFNHIAFLPQRMHRRNHAIQIHQRNFFVGDEKRVYLTHQTESPDLHYQKIKRKSSYSQNISTRKQR